MQIRAKGGCTAFVHPLHDELPEVNGQLPLVVLLAREREIEGGSCCIYCSFIVQIRGSLIQREGQEQHDLIFTRWFLVSTVIEFCLEASGVQMNHSLGFASTLIMLQGRYCLATVRCYLQLSCVSLQVFIAADLQTQLLSCAAYQDTLVAFSLGCHF